MFAGVLWHDLVQVRSDSRRGGAIVTVSSEVRSFNKLSYGSVLDHVIFSSYCS